MQFPVSSLKFQVCKKTANTTRNAQTRKPQLESHFDPVPGHMFLRLAHGVLAIVEYARCEHGIGTALQYPIDEVIERTYAAACDHRYRERIGECTRELEVEAGALSVAVKAGEQNFARAGFFHAPAPLEGIQAARLAPAMGVDLPPRAVGVRHPLGVYRHHDALRPVAGRRFGDEPRV